MKTRATPDAIVLPLGLRVLRRLPLPRKLGLLERLYGSGLARCGVAWTPTAAGPLWKLDWSDACQRWIVYGDYEGPEQMGWIRRWLRDGDVVVDSGANIGQMLLYFATTARTRILAFEPLPAARAWLSECLSRQSGWDVTVLDCGLGADACKVVLQVHGAMSTTRLDWYSARALEKVEIRVESLDSMLDALEVDRVRLWKLDVEGGESAAIQGARRSLEARRVEAVLVETAPEAFAQLRANFDAAGFSLCEMLPGGTVRTATRACYGNLLALPVEHARAVRRA